VLQIISKILFKFFIYIDLNVLLFNFILTFNNIFIYIFIAGFKHYCIIHMFMIWGKCNNLKTILYLIYAKSKFYCNHVFFESNRVIDYTTTNTKGILICREHCVDMN